MRLMKPFECLAWFTSIAMLIFAGCENRNPSSPGPFSPKRGVGEERGFGIGFKFPQIQTRDSDTSPICPDKESSNAPLVLIFTRTDCPISNRYAPEVGRIVEEFAPRQVRFWLVYPDPSLSEDRIRQHLREYEYPCAALWDPDHKLVKATGVSVTPEVAVYDRSHRHIYRGRIDDRHLDLNKSRASPTQHDLRDVLNALLAGSDLTFYSEKATGCVIADLNQ